MGKKILVILLTLLGIGLLFLAVLTYLGFFKPELAGIMIETEPISEVYINGQKVGKTPYDATREPEDVIIKLVPVSDTSLDDYETKVTLVPGVKTIIKRTFKESEDQTSGAIVSFEKVTGTDSGLVTVVTIPDSAEISLDGKIHGYSPLRTKVKEGDHELLVSQVGYLDKKLPIKVYKGYKLTAVVKLTKDALQNEPLVPVISDTQSQGKLEVLPTDVGFLRVRDEPSLNSSVLGQVKPGETYDILEQEPRDGDAAWYKIKVKIETNDNQTQEFEGWVSGEFVKKLE
jgi:hypothetical protein